MPIRLQTQVELPKERLNIDSSDRVVLLGSCFSDRIGEHFSSALINCTTNPFGTLYNPASIAGVISMSEEYPDNNIYWGHDALGRWFSYMHDTAFTDYDKGRLTKRINSSYKQMQEALSSANFLFVTFGTNHVYTLAEEPSVVVSNCHKMPAQNFVERCLSIDDITEIWTTLMHSLMDKNPELRVVFTVSPYRYMKYGLHENQLSKSALLIAIDRLVDKFSGKAFYFPAYEIVNDELRDYRFYEADMVHPSMQASDYIWERLADWAFTPDMRLYVAEAERITISLRHRPNKNSDTQEYLHFLDKLKQRIEQFKSKYPQACIADAERELQFRLEHHDIRPEKEKI